VLAATFTTVAALEVVFFCKNHISLLCQVIILRI
jgi:hypothetical protein